jgi:prevent-host-death family protein
MKIKSKFIGSFEAKTHLASLIEDVQKGGEYIITRRGKPVARLVPFKDEKNVCSMKDTIAGFDAIRNSIGEKTDIKKFIDEGRKY